MRLITDYLAVTIIDLPREIHCLSPKDGNGLYLLIGRFSKVT
jgi:hypothetical protein